MARVTNGVQPQCALLDADRPVHAVEQGDDLDVNVGIICADGLGPQLVMLAITAGLGPLVAKVRPDVPGLPRCGRVVLEEGAHHRRCALRPQGEVPVALVLEVVHLLAHDVG